MKKLWQKIVGVFKTYVWAKWVALAAAIVIALTAILVPLLTMGRKEQPESSSESSISVESIVESSSLQESLSKEDSSKEDGSSEAESSSFEESSSEEESSSFEESFSEEESSVEAESSSSEEESSFEEESSVEDSSMEESSAEIHEHTYTAVVTRQPTCERVGIKTYTCQCGDTFYGSIAKTGHNYKDGSCIDCGAVDPNWEEVSSSEESSSEEEISSEEESSIEESSSEVHIHDYIESVTVEPACEEAGELTYTCECGDFYTEEIAPLGHDLIEYEKNATCEREGWSGYRCDVCYYEEVIEILPVTDHNMQPYTAHSTCIWEGWSGYRCKWCREYEERLEILPLEEHIWWGKTCRVCYTVDFWQIGAEMGESDLAYLLSNDGTYYIVVDVGYYQNSEDILIIPSTNNGLPVKEIYNGKWDHDGAFSAYREHIRNEYDHDEDYYYVERDYYNSIIIPDSVTSIGDYAFNGQRILTEITLPDSVTSIGDYAFAECISLTSVEIGDSVTSIGDYAFRYCNSLTSVEIGDRVTSIGNEAFYGCSSLTSVKIGDSVTSIGEDVFGSCSDLTSIEVSENNSAYKSIDGNLYSKDGKTLIQYAIGQTATSFTIPDSVTNIADKAFSDCTSLTSVVIGDSVTSIGDEAFAGCTSLTSLVIPDSVTSIGVRAFESCESLTSVVIGDSVTSIGSYAFEGTGYYNNEDNWENDVLYIGKYLIDVKDSIEGKYTIKENTLCIGDGAFRYCDSLTSVNLTNR